MTNFAHGEMLEQKWLQLTSLNESFVLEKVKRFCDVAPRLIIFFKCSTREICDFYHRGVHRSSSAWNVSTLQYFAVVFSYVYSQRLLYTNNAVGLMVWFSQTHFSSVCSFLLHFFYRRFFLYKVRNRSSNASTSLRWLVRCRCCCI